jgi:hypothetical protein
MPKNDHHIPKNLIPHFRHIFTRFLPLYSKFMYLFVFFRSSLEKLATTYRKGYVSNKFPSLAKQGDLLSLRAADCFAPSPCEAGRGLGCGDGNPNQFQREFDSNVAIATQDFFSCLSQSPENTNLFKLSSCSLCLSGESKTQRIASANELGVLFILAVQSLLLFLLTFDFRLLTIFRAIPPPTAPAP